MEKEQVEARGEERKEKTGMGEERGEVRRREEGLSNRSGGMGRGRGRGGEERRVEKRGESGGEENGGLRKREMEREWGNNEGVIWGAEANKGERKRMIKGGGERGVRVSNMNNHSVLMIKMMIMRMI